VQRLSELQLLGPQKVQPLPQAEDQTGLKRQAQAPAKASAQEQPAEESCRRRVS